METGEVVDDGSGKGRLMKQIGRTWPNLDRQWRKFPFSLSHTNTTANEREREIEGPLIFFPFLSVHTLIYIYIYINLHTKHIYIHDFGKSLR